MPKEGKIQLKTSRLKSIPFNSYDDFTFIVNGEQFKTNRLFADLISPKISQIHFTDPTKDSFIINTISKGDFSIILNLINFEEKKFNETEIEFITEIIELLGEGSINISIKPKNTKITTSNVFKLLHKHQSNPEIYSKSISKEIEFISLNFYEFCEENFKEISKLDINTIIEIINNSKIQINDEDQLLSFINKLYSNDERYSILYEYVYFKNASQTAMNEFIDVFNINDLTNETWISLSNRLRSEIKIKEVQKKDKQKNRYKQAKHIQNKQKGIQFLYESNKNFDGIFNYLRKNCNGNINEVLTITASSIYNVTSRPQNVILFENADKIFYSDEKKNNWLSFEFKKHQIIPTNYTIKSYDTPRTMKNWVIEVSNDTSNWIIIDQRTNCSDVKERGKVHTFQISNKINEPFRFIRLRHTGFNWNNDYFFTLDSFELYGTLIESTIQ